MKATDILNRIIDEGGNCCWSSAPICKECPMSKLKTKPDGSYMSCIEALGANGMNEDDADMKYKEVATKLLLNATIDDILGTPSGSK